MRTATRLIAIDLDGTLVDSAPDLAFAVDTALTALDLPPAGFARVRGWIGDGIEVLLERALTDAGVAVDARIEAALAEFTAAYSANSFTRSRLYDGVVTTLAALAARDIRLACVTNKRETFALAVLEQAGIRDAFEVVIGGDTLPRKKPDPLPLVTAADRLGVAADAATMVGDSHHDFHAAVTAGFAFVWARYGYCPDLGDTGGREFRKIDAFAELATLV